MAKFRNKGKTFKHPQNLWCRLCSHQLNPGHPNWACPIYNTTRKIRERLSDKDWCVACTEQGHVHKKGCITRSIEEHNNFDSCRRCGGIDHVFWTCDGKPHPGSQYKFHQNVSEKSHVYDQAVTKLQNNNERAAETIDNDCMENKLERILDCISVTLNINKGQIVIKENNLPDKSETTSPIEPTPLDIVNEVCKKLENNLETIIDSRFEKLNLTPMSQVAHSNLDYVKKLEQKYETLLTENDQLREKVHKDSNDAKEIQKYVKQLEYTVEKEREAAEVLATENLKLNDLIKSIETKYSAEIVNIQQMLNDTMQENNEFKENSAAKDLMLKENEKISVSYQHYVKQLCATLTTMFPDLETDDTIDTAAFIKMLETKARYLSNASELTKITDSKINVPNEHQNYWSEQINEKDKIIEQLKLQIEKFHLELLNSKELIVKHNILEKHIKENYDHIKQIKIDIEQMATTWHDELQEKISLEREPLESGARKNLLDVIQEEFERKIVSYFGYTKQIYGVTPLNYDPNLGLNPALSNTPHWYGDIKFKPPLEIGEMNGGQGPHTVGGPISKWVEGANLYHYDSYKVNNHLCLW